jgi:hypothetical protein
VVKRGAPARTERGAVLAVVLVLLLAGALLSAAVAASAAIETAMAGQSMDTAAAFSAAEAGVTTALRSTDWGPGPPWTGSETLGQAAWEATIMLAAASVASDGTVPEWHFEIESRGTAGRAATSIVQGFVVTGALPGTPVLTYWRQEAPEP